MILTNMGWEIPLIEGNPFDSVQTCDKAKKLIIKMNLRKYQGKYFHEVECFFLSSKHYTRVDQYDGT
jgi:activator of HSP90 ATPase